MKSSGLCVIGLVGYLTSLSIFQTVDYPLLYISQPSAAIKEKKSTNYTNFHELKNVL
jgi:hypothetical protein